MIRSPSGQSQAGLLRRAGPVKAVVALMAGAALGASLLSATLLLLEGDGLAASIAGGFALAPLILLPLLPLL